MQYLGIQDAPRKFRPPSQDQAGAWTGTIFKVGKDEITKSVSQEKWMKVKNIIENLAKLTKDHLMDRPELNQTDLESNTGFLNHMAMTYHEMILFLKGFYLTLNSWRGKRDDDDRKMTDKTWMKCLVAQLESGAISNFPFDKELLAHVEPGCPREVTASTHFGDDVQALSALMDPAVVPEVSLRSRRIVTVIYGFGDSSGSGLGSTFTCGGGFSFRIGVWGPDDAGQTGVNSQTLSTPWRTRQKRGI